MWIVEVALKRPYTFIVLALLIPLIGALTIMGTPLRAGMPTDIFPDIKIPIIAVTFQYTGMPPDEMAGRITAQIDHAFNEHHQSRWGMFGFLEFEDDRDVLEGLLDAAATWLRARGCEQVIFIGSDAPALKVYDLLAAAHALERADVVLIPAADGGVTLMGSRVAWPNFADLPWGGSSLGEALQGCCRQHGLSVLRKLASFDVDEASDLMTARVALVGDKRPARRRLRDLLLTAGETPRRCETGAPSPASEKPRL